MQTVRILVTGNPGLEDIMALEALEEAGKYARSVREARGQGRIIVEAEDHPALVARLARMRSAHGIVLLLYEGRVGKDRRALDTIKEAVRGSGIHEHLPRHSTFAVEAERMGEGHEYTSMDIARAVGEAVINATVERAGWKPMVRLNSPHVVVYAEVYGEDFRVGVSLSGEYSMHRRGYRVYDHPAALKPSIAYSMVRISGAADGSTIVDPMCGGGTIAIEAALLFESSRIACMDKSSAHLKGAIANATMAGVANRVDFILGDAREMDNYFEPETIEAIISNP
ncbi:MAG: THUMP domain-containing protein, partial [Desulfurococcales archaeon]|nr:THUMP domain-containing protein [Desulfurococcales archaeon]